MAEKTALMKSNTGESMVTRGSLGQANRRNEDEDITNSAMEIVKILTPGDQIRLITKLETMIGAIAICNF